MAEGNQELVEILSKIYHHDWSKQYKLKNDQIELINLATGEEIIKIAYDNRWKLATLLINADKMIDEHNEKIQKQVLRDLKKLSVGPRAPHVKKQKPILIDPELVERRILQETIEEVLGEAPAEEEEEIDIEKELARRNVFLPTIMGVASEPQHDFATPSLDRGQISAPAFTMDIVQSTPIDFHTVPGVEPFGEASLQELGECGILAGPSGKQYYDSYKSRENFQNARETVENVPRRSSIPQGRDRPHELIAHISPKVMKAIETADNVQLDFDVAEAPEASDAVALLPLGPDPLDNVNQNQSGRQEIAVPVQSPATNRSHLSRRELFEKLAEEIEQAKINQKVPNRRRQRRRRRVPQAAPAAKQEFLELNRPLIRHKRRTKVAKLRSRVDRLSVGPSMYENLEHYVDDDPAWDEVDLPVVNEEVQNASAADRQVQISQVDLPEIHSMDVPSSAAKRSRLDVPVIAVQQQQFIEEADDDMLPVVRERASVAAPPASDDFLSQLAPKIAESKRNRLTAAEIELAKLRNSALPEEEMIPISTIIENMRRSRLPVEELQPPRASIVEKKFRIVSGPRELSTTEFVDILNDDGTVQRQSLYAMESLALYLQIRFNLARNQWKMKYDDLLPQLNIGSGKSIQIRMMELAQYDFIKLHWDADEENILEVELAVQE